MRYKLTLIRTTEIDVEFDHDGDLNSARKRVKANLDDFVLDGQIMSDRARIQSLADKP